jgi:aspartyl-tRNA(Asn)/glutamyl-tRNA(Gln) amidotransferase subunit B
LFISEIEEFKELQLPDLPWQRRKRYLELGLKPDDAEMFVRSVEFGDFFDSAIASSTYVDAKLPLLMANYLGSDIAGKIEKGEMTPSWFTKENAKRFGRLMELVAKELLSSRGAKDTLHIMLTSEGEPEDIAREKNLLQQSDEATLATVAQKVVDAHPSVAADYRSGKEAALQFLVGQGMKETGGSANPQALRSAIQKILS